MKVSEVIVPKEIVALIVFCVAINLLRTALYGSWTFIFLLWNLFLAFIPFLISSALSWHVHHAKVSRFEVITAGVFWLVMFPNAPYLVTDFINLGESLAAPMWFDILLIFSSAWIGLQFAFYSLSRIEELLLMRYSATMVRITLVVILAFTSFGIYLGRFLRFNSWDFIANPVQLLGDITRIMLGQYRYPEAFFFSFVFFCFLSVTYVAWKFSQNARA